MDTLLLKAVVSDSLGVCKKGQWGAMFRVSKVRNTGVGDARSSDGGEVRGPEIGDWLALGEHLGWPKVSLFLLDHEKGYPKIGI